jgi:tetratricopeptide (TPR) repeat protein
LLSKEELTHLNWAWYFYHLGTLSSFRKNFSKAKEQFLKGLNYFEKTEDPLGQSATFVQLGETACQQGACAESRRYFQKAMRFALQSRILPLLVDGFVGIAQLLKAEGDERQAISFLLVALAHPSCRRQTKDRVVNFSLDLQSQFSSEEMEGAVQWAKAARIEDLAASWIASHEKVPVSRRKSPRAKPRKASKKTRKKTKRKR